MKMTFESEKFPMVLNDPVHGHIELDPLYVRIIDTPQYQRLRFLHQCGTAHFVFPGAHHTRFEHCIGVGHLAESVVKALQARQPELNITDADVKCVAIAGLCHDLGHGPFSHVFDRGVMSHFDQTWKHEYASLSMFDYLIKENNLEKYFVPEDLIFIKELIYPYTSEQGDGWFFKGRGPEKSFLYDIVSNKRNGIDVDKWDYIVRDCYFMGISTAFDHKRLIKFLSVLKVDNERQICARDKEVDNMYELFHSRTRLYRQAYLHKTSLIIDCILSRALVLANDFIIIEGENGKKYKMSETVNDMTAYVKLTDRVFEMILYSTDDNLKPARKLLERITRRQLPKSIGALKCDDSSMTEDVMKDELMKYSEEYSMSLNRDDIVIIKSKWDYGMNYDDPINHMWFYNKDRPTKPYKPLQVSKSCFMPKKFKEVRYLVFCEGADAEKFEKMSKCLHSLCEKHNLQNV